eukprot:m.193979 g.193979  ORF g.193979 m.193979 type:complete len:57 (-) comp14887_c0_seq2:87-257(-)
MCVEELVQRVNENLHGLMRCTLDGLTDTGNVIQFELFGCVHESQTFNKSDASTAAR